MGYHTYYTLDIEGHGQKWVSGVDRNGNHVEVNIGLDHEDIKSELYDLSNGQYNNADESTKWYEHDNDMIKISKKYPDLLFILTGVGEDFGEGDCWRKYYKNGKYQYTKGRIEYEPFDPNKLQDLTSAC